MRFENPAYLLFFLALLTIAPIFLMMLTSFVKISIVFSILRSALGTSQVPPNIVIMGISLVLTLYIMSPVGERIKTSMENESVISLKADAFTIIKKGWNAGMSPLKQFLSENSHPDISAMFWKLAGEVRSKKNMPLPPEDSFIVLIPSFMISELKEAFEMGFVIYLPFLVFDMLISSILVSMGMHMLSPVTVSLPFKLLLFVTVNGWELLSKSLVLGYRV